MKTDGGLKYLFRRLTRGLLGVLGERGAIVHDAASLELQEIQRRLDLVLELERDGLRYFHHLEFNAYDRKHILERSAVYGLLASVQLEAPVITTIIQVQPPALGPDPAYRVMMGETEINRWRFRTLNLWELSARKTLELGSPALLALTPLMKDGSEKRVEQALRVLNHLETTDEVVDARALLLGFAEERYPGCGLRELMTREQLMQSTFLQEIVDEEVAKRVAKARAEARAEALAEGALQTQRTTCLAMVEEFHPALVTTARPAIETCSDTELLSKWVRRAPRITDDAEYARLLGLH